MPVQTQAPAEPSRSHGNTVLHRLFAGRVPATATVIGKPEISSEFLLRSEPHTAPTEAHGHFPDKGPKSACSEAHPPPPLRQPICFHYPLVRRGRAAIPAMQLGTKHSASRAAWEAWRRQKIEVVFEISALHAVVGSRRANTEPASEEQQ